MSIIEYIDREGELRVPRPPQPLAELPNQEAVGEVAAAASH